MKKESSYNLLKPSVRIGKSGISDNLIEEIKKNLKKRKVIKVKCLRYYLDAFEGDSNKDKIKDIAENIRVMIEKQDVKCDLIEIKGFTFIFKSDKNE
ncbi:MAG: YhbY family RNA-binding protein [Nanobdellota archaeon]